MLKDKHTDSVITITARGARRQQWGFLLAGLRGVGQCIMGTG